MPELIEVETYRRQAEAAVGRRIVAVPVVDEVGLRNREPDALRAEVEGVTVGSARRIGKLLLLDTDGPVIGLRFGMTGRLLVDGRAGIDRLEYGGQGDDPAWDRFVFRFADGGEMRIRDPRRLGGVEIDPDVDVLGPDAASIQPPELADALSRSRAPLKSRLLDQHRIAGLGNLLVDETLWRVGLDPERPCDRLAAAEIDALAATIRDTVADLSRRGGSHTGELQPARQPGASCPADGAPLDRLRVGGRTTYRCPEHQR